MDKLSRLFGLAQPLKDAIAAGLPVYGTCAGMIMLADTILDGIEGQQSLGGLDIDVRRNAFGSQTDSFEVDLDIPELGRAGAARRVHPRAGGRAGRAGGPRPRRARRRPRRRGGAGQSARHVVPPGDDRRPPIPRVFPRQGRRVGIPRLSALVFWTVSDSGTGVLMSGHSKWATTKHQKAVTDSRRAKAFAKLIKNIEVAAKMGGADLSGNPTLVDAIQKAKKTSVPNDNIDRAVKRGAGLSSARRRLQDDHVRGLRPGRRRPAHRVPHRQQATAPPPTCAPS